MTTGRFARLSAASALGLSTFLSPIGLPPAGAASDPVVVAAGDIATCNSGGDGATADLVGSIPATVLTLGDKRLPRRVGRRLHPLLRAHLGPAGDQIPHPTRPRQPRVRHQGRVRLLQLLRRRRR